jgi:hypothetical protein
MLHHAEVLLRKRQQELLQREVVRVDLQGPLLFTYQAKLPEYRL